MRFVAIGHVTDDRLIAEDGARADAAGGSALYAGLAAARLGAEARVVTSAAAGAAALARLAAAGVALATTPAEATTTFVNDYRGGARRQRVTARAADLVAAAAEADAVLACPVIGEIAGPLAPLAAGGALVGAGLQGWLRALDADGTVRPRTALDVDVLAGCTAVFLSVEDLGDDGGRLRGALVARVPIVVVTDGARGAAVYHEHARLTVPAAPAREVDPTGAGDLFATAMLLALARGDGVREAAIAGACAGAIAVEAVGADAVAGLARFDERRAAWRRANGA